MNSLTIAKVRKSQQCQKTMWSMNHKTSLQCRCDRLDKWVEWGKKYYIYNFENVHSHNTEEVGRFKQRIFRETGPETDIGWFHFRIKCDGRPWHQQCPKLLATLGMLKILSQYLQWAKNANRFGKQEICNQFSKSVTRKTTDKLNLTADFTKVKN